MSALFFCQEAAAVTLNSMLRTVDSLDRNPGLAILIDACINLCPYTSILGKTSAQKKGLQLLATP
jgi:hypothetical protein